MDGPCPDPEACAEAERQRALYEMCGSCSYYHTCAGDWTDAEMTCPTHVQSRCQSCGTTMTPMDGDGPKFCLECKQGREERAGVARGDVI